MCRVLSYLGKSILIEDLLYKPNNSFIKQTYHPIYMPYLLNLAGFGMVAWDNYSTNPHLPFIYKTDELPFYDENLRNLTQKLVPSCLLTHIRGVAYNDLEVVSKQNVHPFLFPNTNIAFAHNGVLYNFEKMKYDLLEHISPINQNFIRGTTDSEWIYAMFLSLLQKSKDENLLNNIINTFKELFAILKKIRYKHNIRVNSPMNIFISNGEFIATTRFVFDFGWQPLTESSAEHKSHFTYHSLWYTFGEKFELENGEYQMKKSHNRSSIIIASEPLTEDTTTWIEVPEYTLLIARLVNNEIEIHSSDIAL